MITNPKSPNLSWRNRGGRWENSYLNQIWPHQDIRCQRLPTLLSISGCMLKGEACLWSLLHWIYPLAKNSILVYSKEGEISPFWLANEEIIFFFNSWQNVVTFIWLTNNGKVASTSYDNSWLNINTLCRDCTCIYTVLRLSPQGWSWLFVHHYCVQHKCLLGSVCTVSILPSHKGNAKSILPGAQVLYDQVRHISFFLARWVLV